MYTNISFELNSVYLPHSAGAAQVNQLYTERGLFYVYLHTNTTLSPHQETNSPIRQRNTSVLSKVVPFSFWCFTPCSFQEHLSLTLLITQLHREASSAELSTQNPCQNPTDQINKGLGKLFGGSAFHCRTIVKVSLNFDFLLLLHELTKHITVNTGQTLVI